MAIPPLSGKKKKIEVHLLVFEELYLAYFIMPCGLNHLKQDFFFSYLNLSSSAARRFGKV